MSVTAKQREERKRIVLKARLRVRGTDCEAQILDASSRGLSMTAARIPPRGEIVEVMLGRSVMAGQVRWSRANRFGVVLHERIDLAALHRGVIAPQSGLRSAQSAAPVQGFATHDKLFLAAAALAAVVFLIHAARTWI
jgi:hypothetical protein